MKINKMNPEDARERMRPLYEAARAMSELAEGACGSELYGIVKKHLFDELDAATRAMMDSCNAYADSAEHARASVAGPDVRMDAVKGEQSFTTGHGRFVDRVIRQIGFGRIGTSDAWELVLNDEPLEGTAIPEADMKRIDSAINSWIDRKLQEQREKQAGEPSRG